ncbi:uncharacterized protein MONBRDRAFT_9725 [Monosiga brevicollis MX1]|uniref:Biogenesis of lysosome-related organelles complex 1 subunit 5 n=1 Tax=Monosiga brevicollis TaxID=81824 RepID=A9V3L0_MONBE|nr:uncharacterized protein MONBRDRAFT_9725 [Monosiga brevicollis MX1]EDQ87931.1 predicted protein [Monosiga brevicollis MX1]|eukprot:XP_001747464.1 hypothetical protein [Monosiga brevicollis MX1]
MWSCARGDWRTAFVLLLLLLGLLLPSATAGRSRKDWPNTAQSVEQSLLQDAEALKSSVKRDYEKFSGEKDDMYKHRDAIQDMLDDAQANLDYLRQQELELKEKQNRRTKRIQERLHKEL